MEDNFKAVIYARVSTKKQDNANQILALRKQITRDWGELVRIFEDTISGTRKAKERPKYQEMLELIREKKVDCVYFYAYDRLTRSGAFEAHEIIRDFEKYGVRYKSLLEGWLDSENPFKDVFISVFATIAKNERDKLVERTRTGLERAKRDGKKLGRPSVDVPLESLRQKIKLGLTNPELAKIFGIGLSTLKRFKAALKDNKFRADEKGFIRIAEAGLESPK